MNSARILAASLLFSLFTLLSSNFASAQCELGQTIANPAPGQSDGFGNGVAISGDLIVVGAPRDAPDGGPKVGAAYVFNAMTGELVATLLNPEPEQGDNFGAAVAISGNVAAVGAPQDRPVDAHGAGTVYTFNATTGNLIATLNNPAPGTSIVFGRSLSMSGNLVAIGAEQDAPGDNSHPGMAYVFNATSGGIVAQLNNPRPGTIDFFGKAIGIDGDRVVVGAALDSLGGVPQGGAAYIFSASGPLLQTLRKPTTANSGDIFGVGVAISGNVAVVGAVETNDLGGAGFSNGRAYLFDVATGEFLRSLDNPSESANSPSYGLAVAIDGETAVVGAVDFSTVGSLRGIGKAFVFNAPSGDLLATLDNPTPGEFDGFASTLALSGNRVLIGGKNDDIAPFNDAGSAYLFACSPPGPTPTPNPAAIAIADILLGGGGDPSGLDLNTDGALDVADLILAQL